MSPAHDVIAFTGSSETAGRILRHPNILARGVHVNIEADSVNAALLAPDASQAAFDAFIKEVSREMTVKAGQKCTAIRRVFAPAERADAVAEALLARLKKTTLGDPRDEAVRMGPRGDARAAGGGVRRDRQDRKGRAGADRRRNRAVDRWHRSGEVCLRCADADAGCGWRQRRCGA